MCFSMVSAHICINTPPPLCTVLKQPSDPQTVVVGWKCISFTVVVPCRPSINHLFCQAGAQSLILIDSTWFFHCLVRAILESPVRSAQRLHCLSLWQYVEKPVICQIEHQGRFGLWRKETLTEHVFPSEWHSHCSTLHSSTLQCQCYQQHNILTNYIELYWVAVLCWRRHEKLCFFIFIFLF